MTVSSSRRLRGSDPVPARVDAPPFGAAWLRGLTLSRVGLVAALCLIFSIRQGVSATDHNPWLDVIWNDLQFAAIQMLCLTPIMLLVTAADNASASAAAPTRVAALAAAVCLGAVAYAILYWSILGPIDYFWEFFRSMFLRVVAWGGFLTSALFFVERERQMTEATQRAQRERVDFERQFEEARLRLLEAQIEPHFLFNTLANIKGLCRDDPRHGRGMILDLAHYLRAALPSMREDTSTLGRELALVSAYLRVLKIRMAGRLEVRIDVASHLHQARLPPMMLITLVENAVKHGIGPLRHGGIVSIGAERVAAKLRVSVSDNGVGLRESSGAGFGLANLRSRLATTFSGRAALRLAANPVAGVTAVIEVPWQDSTPVRTDVH